MRLPRFLAASFWDRPIGALSWRRDRDFIVRRILEAGDWRSVSWLRSKLGDDGLRSWLSDRNRRRRGLSRRKVRFWELVLGAPLDHLLDDAAKSPWPH